MRFRYVLFDWRGTLFHDESDHDWIHASALSIRRHVSDAEITELAQALAEAEVDARVVEARRRADCSVELNRAASLLQLQLAGFDDELAVAVWRRDGDVAATQPYSDTASVLRALKARGVGVGIVSDIHYDLRPLFEHYGLVDAVDAFTLSFHLGVQKPDRRLFDAALESLGAPAAATLMVGDRASRDGGAVSAGITTLILPLVSNGEPRGLEVVLRLVE
jgi:FMN phosphatase YigB (HAD superfamily)